ncbi:MAG: hypothetical protein NZ523_08245 [Elioraea sp.]|nr:hypothetical protein [Elioraea sp.]
MPATRPLLRRLVVAGLALALPLVLLLLAAELALRALPVASGMRAQPVNEASPVFRFAPDRDFVYSVGWNFALVHRGRTNNEGFVSDIPYDRADRRPLLAVVGDSYVEAAMVPWAETLQGRLHAAAQPHAKVYSFGAAGSPLSQYLVFASHAARAWGAEAIVIPIIGNDFDESLARYSPGRGFHLFVETAGGLELQRFDWQPSPVTQLVRHSALIRYVHFNLGASGVINRVRWRLAGVDLPRGFVGNVAAEVEPERLALSERAIDRFLELLPEMTGLSPSRVLFLLDGRRPHLYEPHTLSATDDTYFARMRRSFAAKAEARGFGVIDLEPLFMAEHSRNGRRFEFAVDAHWSGEGHRVAAEAVLGSPLWREFLGAAQN